MQVRYEVISPYHGEILKILYKESSVLSPLETLFIIETVSGIEEISLDYFGIIDKIEVSEGDRIIPGMVLAHVQYVSTEGII